MARDLNEKLNPPAAQCRVEPVEPQWGSRHAVLPYDHHPSRRDWTLLLAMEASDAKCFDKACFKAKIDAGKAAM